MVQIGIGIILQQNRILLLLINTLNRITKDLNLFCMYISIHISSEIVLKL